MYLKEINIENYGGIKKINYKLPFYENGNPKPLVLIGKNGSGKTLLISNIVHSLIEMKRKVFDEIPETDKDHFYRIGSKEYIKSGTNYSYVNYLFSNDVHLTDFATNNYESIKSLELNNININNEKLKNTGFFNEININSTNKQKIKSIFETNIFMYLPVDRYYSPNWLNNSNSKIRFNSNYSSYVGINNDNIIKTNLLNDLESWLLDVIIDKMLYEQQELKQNINKGNKEFEKTFYIYNGKNSKIQEHINRLLTKMLKLNNPKITSARIGVSQKQGRTISILYSIDQKEYEYVPKFSNLSSGEVMVLGMFASILKEFDRVFDIGNTNIDQLSGIVIIDEIDIHLHLDFCRLILPQMIEMFPKIQFIITSHSPFFLLGMKEKFDYNCEFLNMPSGLLNEIDNFEEIKKMYELVEYDNEKKIKKIEEYEKKLKDVSKPIIITEGKTDWKHLKNALLEFQNRGKFKDLDIEFLEYENNMGDSELEVLLNKVSIFNDSHKIIGIFDNDEKVGQKYDKIEYKDFGNKVYGFCIPNPRNLPYGISIEFLYNDSDIKLESNDGKRLYLSDEFKEKNLQYKSNPLIVTNQRNFISTYYRTGQVKILENNEVFDEHENSVALSKNEFAENIINKVKPFDQVNIDNFEEVFKKIEKIINLP